MTEVQQYELSQLYEKIIAESATEREVAEFEKTIMNNPDALRFYHDLTFQHSYLHTSLARDAQETPKSRKANKRRSLITTITAYTAVAAAVVLGTILIFQTNEPPQRFTDQPTYATLSSSSVAQWGQCSLPTQLNHKLQQGSLELLKGTATLTFDSGAMVTLEAPAEIEIISGMRAIVNYGRVVADVPETAIGFRLDTPEMEVKDLGTIFAVSVDRKQGTSQVDVLDGEVEIFHEASQDRKLLLEKQRATATKNSTAVEYSVYNELSDLKRSSFTAKINQKVVSTAYGNGGHATIISDHADTHLYPDLLQAKHSINGIYSRKFYLKFDISQLTSKDYGSITLQLDQVRSPYGFASFVPDSIFNVYALTDESLEDWKPESLNWENAPANDLKSGASINDQYASVIGSFTIPKGQQEGLCHIQSSKLSEMIKQDTNGSLTLIITRTTTETQMEGLVHTFAGNNTANASPPQLIFTSEK